MLVTWLNALVSPEALINVSEQVGGRDTAAALQVLCLVAVVLLSVRAHLNQESQENENR
jgi:hypothetical protein